MFLNNSIKIKKYFDERTDQSIKIAFLRLKSLKCEIKTNDILIMSEKQQKNLFLGI